MIKDIKTEMKEVREKFSAIAKMEAERFLLNRIIWGKLPELGSFQSFSQENQEGSVRCHVLEEEEEKRVVIIERESQISDFDIENILSGRYSENSPSIDLTLYFINKNKALSWYHDDLFSLIFYNPDFSKEGIVTGEFNMRHYEAYGMEKESERLVEPTRIILKTKMEKIGIFLQEEKEKRERERGRSGWVIISGTYQIKVE